MTTWTDREWGGDERRYFIQMGLAFLSLLGLTIVPFTLNGEMGAFYLSEGGPIQVFSAAGYLIAVVTLVREMPRAKLLRHWYFIVVPLTLCLRELDFHAHFTTYNITKTTLYVSPDTPLWEKLLGVFIFAVIGLAVYGLLKDHYRPFLRGLRRGGPVSWAVFAAIGCAVLAKILDGAESNLAFLGIHVSATFTSMVFEEVLELGIPVFLSIAAFAAFPRDAGAGSGTSMR